MFVAVLIVVITLFYNGNLKPGLLSSDRTKCVLEITIWREQSFMRIHGSYWFRWDLWNSEAIQSWIITNIRLMFGCSDVASEMSFEPKVISRSKLVKKCDYKSGSCHPHGSSRSNHHQTLFDFWSNLGQISVECGSKRGHTGVKTQFHLFYRHGALLNLGSCKMWIITTVYYLNIWK